MKIKELEDLLSISRSNIRFYEKQGLFTPDRQKNNYRDYTEQDVLALKRIIVLRKMGFTVEEIKSIQNNELSFSEAMCNTKKRLEEEIEQLNGALKLLGQVSKEYDSFEQINVQKHWSAMRESEKSGEKFIDLCKDYLDFELSVFDIMWKFVFFHDSKRFRTQHGIWKAFLFLLLLCIARGIGRALIHKESFWSGFLYPFILFVIGSIILLPLFLIGKKYPKIASIIACVFVGLGLLFFAGIIILILCGIIGIFT